MIKISSQSVLERPLSNFSKHFHFSARPIEERLSYFSGQSFLLPYFNFQWFLKVLLRYHCSHRYLNMLKSIESFLDLPGYSSEPEVTAEAVEARELKRNNDFRGNIEWRNSNPFMSTNYLNEALFFIILIKDAVRENGFYRETSCCINR